MNASEIKIMLKRHSEWLADSRIGEKANLKGADLSGTNLSGANLEMAVLVETNLVRANLMNSNLKWAELNNSDLRKANLIKADMEGAFLEGVDLRWADLNEANLRGVDFIGANLEFARVRGANFYLTEMDKAIGAPIVMHIESWDIYIQRGYMRIGCEEHPFTEWENFTDVKIASMDDRALKFWRKYKSALMALCKENYNAS